MYFYVLVLRPAYPEALRLHSPRAVLLVPENALACTRPHSTYTPSPPFKPSGSAIINDLF